MPRPLPSRTGQGPDRDRPSPSAQPDPVAEACARGVRLLAGREHSRAELARKLAARGFEPGDVARALDRLAESGALSDARAAERYVAERAAKGFGPLRIRAELLEKGVPESLFGPYLGPMDAAWPELLAAAHDRRFGSEPPADRADYARRGRFLEQRGFPAGLIRRHLAGRD
jgi:regulatory protein